VAAGCDESALDLLRLNRAEPAERAGASDERDECAESVSSSGNLQWMECAGAHHGSSKSVRAESKELSVFIESAALGHELKRDLAAHAN
jgi:hypothetical protein